MKIDAKYLTQVYRDGTYGLDDFSININSGDFVTVVGESGCGKTTLLRVLAGLEKLASGELYLNGVMSSDIPLKQRKTSMVFQDYALYPRFTVWENLQAALERYDLSTIEENKRIKRALADFDLLEVAGQLPKNLSGGQQQRVALAKAVVTRPELLLFDEPLSNVAEKQRSAYMLILKQLKQRLPKTTFIYVTHNGSEALTLGNKLLVMKDGKALQYGDTAFVASNPCSLDVLQTLFPSDVVQTEVIDGQAKVYDLTLAVNLPNMQIQAAYNPFTKNYAVFDNVGDNLLGQSRYLDLKANYDGKTLTVNGLTVPVDENFAYRYVGKLGETKLRIPTDSLSDIPFNNAVEMPIENGKKIYFSMDTAFCVQDGVRVLSHYRTYLSKCIGRISCGRLHLPCGSMPYLGKSGKVIVTVKRGAKASLSPNGYRFDCLSEDDFGQYRYAYCKMKGFDNYVTLNLGQSKARSKHNDKIIFDLNDLELEYI